MIHLSVAVGQFFKLLLTAMLSTAASLIVLMAIAVAGVALVGLAIRAIIRRRRS